MNDLLYIAAAIAPASFNDVTPGQQYLVFRSWRCVSRADGVPITPTGFGYLAGPGYDLRPGLVRRMDCSWPRPRWIVEAQTWFGSRARVARRVSQGGWASAADQTLFFQPMSARRHARRHGGTRHLRLPQRGVGKFRLEGPFCGAVAAGRFRPHAGMCSTSRRRARWCRRLGAGEGLALFDRRWAAQAAPGQRSSNPLRLRRLLSGGGDVRVAPPGGGGRDGGRRKRPVAVVRLRGVAQDNLALSFYRVDDLLGAVNGLRPAIPATRRRQQSRRPMSGGGTRSTGRATAITSRPDSSNVNAGDLVDAAHQRHPTAPATGLPRPTRGLTAPDVAICGTTASTPGAGTTSMAGATETTTTWSSARFHQRLGPRLDCLGSRRFVASLASERGFDRRPVPRTRRARACPAGSSAGRSTSRW